MNRLLRIVTLGAVCACTALALAASSARAQGVMDQPTISVVDSSSAWVELQVTAGPSGAPGGFYVEWMYLSDYNTLGGWPADPYDPSVYYCDFIGQPSLHTGGTNGYLLGSGESINIVLGELFDETGLTTDYTNEIVSGQGVVVRGYTEGSGTVGASDRTASFNCGTPPPPPCVKSEGTWKAHSSTWPVSSMMLGTVSYTKAQIISILNKPAGTNGLISLAHELIATKLNIANGANPALIQTYVNNADALIGSKVIPPVGTGTLTPSSSNSLTDKLDDWNEEKIGHVTCSTTPTRNSTWGELKTLYR
jgi:hypothetical protein